MLRPSVRLQADQGFRALPTLRSPANNGTTGISSMPPVKMSTNSAQRGIETVRFHVFAEQDEPLGLRHAAPTDSD